MKALNSLFVLLLLTISGCSSSSEVTIKDRSHWKALDPKPYQSHIPVRITIHHEGEVFHKGENAAAHIREVQVWGMGSDRNWTDIPYHFLIDPDGNIYEGRNVFTAGETATEYDPTGHLLLTCMGNFEVQDVTEKQLDALVRLTAYSCKKYQISPDSIASHKDYAETLCPGKDLYKYIENGYIKNKVKELLAAEEK
jgi:N-acetyl-anhydromuramyl-L-alanine amidase AmpD